MRVLRAEYLCLVLVVLACDGPSSPSDSATDCFLDPTCQANSSPGGDAAIDMVDGFAADSRNDALDQDATAGGRNQDIGAPHDMTRVCTPSAVDCSPDGLNRSVCGADGLSWSEMPCPDESVCVSGECTPWICRPQTRTCVNNTVRICDDIGSGFVDDPIEDCTGLDAECILGQCVDAVDASRGQTCETIECLSQRDSALICDRYVADILSPTREPFISGEDTCAPGELTDDAYTEALTVLNYGRWLSGLRDVTYDDGLNPRTQACAAMMSNQRALNHNPPESWACYTAEGAQAAGESNLHLSYQSSTVTDAVIAFFQDGGQNNRDAVGHRRWFLSHSLARVGFGFHEATSNGAIGCCYNVIASQAVEPQGPPFIAYPGPGPFPIHWLQSRHWVLPWSVHVHSRFRDAWAPPEEWSVDVWRIEGDEMRPLQVEFVSASDRWYGRSRAIVFTPRFDVTPGLYALRIEGPQGRFEWTTELVDCEN